MVAHFKALWMQDLKKYAALGETPALPASRKIRLPVPRFSMLTTMLHWADHLDVGRCFGVDFYAKEVPVAHTIG